MGTLTGALPFPAFGSRIAVRTRVDYQNSQEGALVRRAQSGDEAAFREIVERYQSKVFSIIHGIVRQRNDVEDIAQQVFAKVLFLHPEFRFPQLADHLDLQDHGERMLRLSAQEEGAQTGVRERSERGRSAPGGEHRAFRRPPAARPMSLWRGAITW